MKFPRWGIGGLILLAIIFGYFVDFSTSKNSLPEQSQQVEGQQISVSSTPIFQVSTTVVTITPRPTATPIPTFTPVPTPTIKIYPTNTSIPIVIYNTPTPISQSSGLSNDNYYTNSAGNDVHSPAYSNTVPAGATAKCGDGTYSFSQSRSGTCSHHGGVAQWL